MLVHTTSCIRQNLFLFSFFFLFLYTSCSDDNSKNRASIHFKFLSMIDHCKIWVLSNLLCHHHYVTSSRRHFVKSPYQWYLSQWLSLSFHISWHKTSSQCTTYNWYLRALTRPHYAITRAQNLEMFKIIFYLN